jgi:hypothetical protein
MAGAQETSTQPASAVDRTDARSTAQAVLQAYKARDLAALAGLSNAGNQQFFSEIAAQGEAHPRYASIFSGWRWDAVQAWDGALRDLRYRGADEARVHFGDMQGDEIAVVVLEWEDGQWAFEDVNSPSRADYQALAADRPAP